MNFFINKTLFTLILAATTFTFAYSQEEPATIIEAYDNMVKEHSTWETFKVIPVTKMEKFGLDLQETITKKDIELQEISSAIAGQKKEVADFKDQVVKLEKALELSQLNQENISFLGIDFNKSAYHTMVWLIIVVLFILGAMAYVLFINAQKSTRFFKKEIESLKEELETQRSQAHEKQIKVKRELQTAMNLLAEKGIKI